MGSRSVEQHKFYHSKNWLMVSKMKLLECNYTCNKCGKYGNHVHHKIPITDTNVGDTNITLSSDNLVVLCQECHNKVHGRGENKAVFDSSGNLIDYKTKDR
jgi:5-methylcytosine-specific restriction endonuclease McrA